MLVIDDVKIDASSNIITYGQREFCIYGVDFLHKTVTVSNKDSETLFRLPLSVFYKRSEDIEEFTAYIEDKMPHILIGS